VYTVGEDVYPDDVQTTLFVPATSQEVGAGHNVGVGVLINHDLGVGGVTVTNEQAIQTGQDIESDTNYRFRISRALAQAAGATEDAIRLAALSFLGVADVQVNPFVDGVGTFEVVVTPIGNSLPTGTLRSIEAAVRRKAAFGSRVRVRAPEPVPVRITVQLVFVKDARDSEKASVRAAVRIAILNYLAEIAVGGVLVVTELTQRVMDVSEKIFDSRVLLFRINNENQVLRNYQLERDELFVPDTSIQEAIVVL
jgi:uncharacterized phage protein gp47/JayE